MENELSDTRLEELDNHLSAFSFRMLRDFMSFKTVCEQKGIDQNEIPKYLKDRVTRKNDFNKRMMETSQEIMNKAPTCDICGSILNLEDVNDIPARMVDDHSKSWWYCPDPDCESKPALSDKYTHEVLADLGVAATEFVKDSILRKQKDNAIGK